MNPSSPVLDRRQVLATASAFLAAHHALATEDPKPIASTRGDGDRPLILSLTLWSAASLESMKKFYHQSLGLPIVEDQPKQLTLQAGLTKLTFRPAAADDGKPFYHFAFNIPENKLLSARAWQKERSPLLPIPESLRDRKFPDDVVHYRHWNAHSLFFFDPAGNVVEYIARHDLKNAASGAFTSKDILCASEIAWVVDDVPALSARLKEECGVEEYKGASELFTALGTEAGLLLVMKRGRVISFDSPQKKAVTVFRTEASVRGPKRRTYRVSKYPYEISVVE